MSLLYLASGHVQQCADDCLMWEELGINYFPTAYYNKENKPGEMPEIKVKIDPLTARLFKKLPSDIFVCDKDDMPIGKRNLQWSGQNPHNLFTLNRKFVSRFSSVMANHFLANITNNLKELKNIKKIFKVFGMHDVRVESQIKELREKHGLLVVRSSPKEHLRELYGGTDAVIRSSVVPNEDVVSGWTGDINRVCVFTNFLGHKDKRWDYIQKIRETCKYPIDIFGAGNENINGGFVSTEQKLEIMKRYRIALVSGTQNSNITFSFVESFIMGQPIVCFGKEMWDSPIYEADEILGDTGFIGTTPEQCASQINNLMENRELCEDFSTRSRPLAISIYGRKVLAEKWKNFFRKNGI